MTNPTASIPKSADQKNWLYLAVIIAVIFYVSITIYSLWEYQSFEFPMISHLRLIKDGLFSQNWNFISCGKIDGVSILKFVYGFYFLTIIMTFLFYICFIHSKRKTLKTSLFEMLTIVNVINVLLISGMEQTKRMEHLKSELLLFKGKSLIEKNYLISGPIYQFAQTCRNSLSMDCRANVLTDVDMDQDPFMFQNRILSYYLYPRISLRFNNNAPENCLLIFYKKNPLSSIPENYRLLVASRDFSYILAVKKQTPYDHRP